MLSSPYSKEKKKIQGRETGVRVLREKSSHVLPQWTAIDGKDTIEFRTRSRKLGSSQLGLKVTVSSDWRNCSRKLFPSIREFQATILQIRLQITILINILDSSVSSKSSAAARIKSSQFSTSKRKSLIRWVRRRLGARGAYRRTW